MPSESISLAIGGSSYTAWDSWWVESDLRTPVDAFELILHTKDTASVRRILHEGGACNLSLGRDRVLTGQIDTVTHGVSRDGVTIKVSGRDNAAVLVDSSAPKVILRNAGLEQIVTELVRPFGFTQFEIRTAVDTTSRLVQYKPEGKAWAALQEVAERYSAWPWIEADGRLVIGNPDYSAAPVGELVMRLDGKGGNVSNLTVRGAYHDSYYQIQVLAQHGQYDTDALDPMRGQLGAAVQDNSVANARTKVVVIHAENQSEVSAKAEELMRESHLDAMQIQAVVPGHRAASGVVWTPGQRVIVRSEPHCLDATYFLMSRKLSLARATGPTTLLRLVRDGLWKPGKFPAGKTETIVEDKNK